MAVDFSPAGLRKSRLRAELQLLAARYGEVSFDQQDGTWVLVRHFPLPAGWSKQEVAILIDVPSGNPGYPQVAPTHFWTDRSLRTKSGQPMGHFFTESVGHLANPKYVELGWGQFCVYIRGWRAAGGIRLQEGHTLLSYLDLISMIFRDRHKLGDGGYGR